MKRYVLCLLVLTGAAAMSNVTACMSMRKAPSNEIKTYVGIFTKGEWGECRDDEGNYCPECPVEKWLWPECGPAPAILIDGTVYFISEYKDQFGTWEQELEAMGFKLGEEIEVKGILFSEYCMDYIQLTDIKRLHMAIDDVYDVDASLDLSKPMYNALGQPVDETYQGIVIQNGHKFVK